MSGKALYFSWQYQTSFESTIHKYQFQISPGPTELNLFFCSALTRTALRENWSQKSSLEEEWTQHITVLLLCSRGSGWPKNSTSLLITYSMERWQNSHHLQSHLCFVFGDWCFFTKTTLLNTFPVLLFTMSFLFSPHLIISYTEGPSLGLVIHMWWNNLIR